MWSKICIICNNKFDSKKINAVCCSQKCRNKAKSLPRELIIKLTHRNSEFTIYKTGLKVSVLETSGNGEIKRVDVISFNQENPQDYNKAMAAALEIKRKRDEKRLIHERLEEIDKKIKEQQEQELKNSMEQALSGMPPHDPEMLKPEILSNRPLAQVARDNEKFITASDPANSPKGFGEKEENTGGE